MRYRINDWIIANSISGPVSLKILKSRTFPTFTL